MVVGVSFDSYCVRPSGLILMERSAQPKINPLIVIAFGILAVSTASIFIRYAQVYVPSIVITVYRLTLATLFLAPIAFTKKRSELSTITRSELVLALLSGIFLALHFAAWIMSLEYTSVASSVVLVSTVPLWVAILSPFLLKEPLTKRVLIGLGLVLVGVLVVGLSDSCTWDSGHLVCPSINDFIRKEAFLGDILALAGAMSAAFYIIIGRRLRVRISLISYIFVVYGMAAIVAVVLMFRSGSSPFGYPPTAYLWLLLIALIPQLLGHSTFNWALGYLSAAYVSIALIGEPIGSMVLAYIFLDEVPTTMKIVGAILILTGIFIASLGEVERNVDLSVVE